MYSVLEMQNYEERQSSLFIVEQYSNLSSAFAKIHTFLSMHWLLMFVMITVQVQVIIGHIY